MPRAATPAAPSTTTPKAPVGIPTLHSTIADTQSELFYLLGHLKGINGPTADRITELVLKMQSDYRAEIEHAKEGAQ